MPILPDSITSGRLPPVTGRRSFAHGLSTTTGELPLMQRSVRCAPPLRYARETHRAQLPDPALSGPSAPKSETVRLWPQNFNAETPRFGQPAPPPGRRATSIELFSQEADVLFPYGHLPRTHYCHTSGVRDSSVVLAARGGVGEARHGDKPYHRSEWSDNFAGTGKPNKWYADPAGRPIKLAWAAGRPAVDSQISGRPLWVRPL